MVQRSGLAKQGFKEQMIDALVFSLAVYETAPEKILSVLRFQYDLPVGALDLLNLEGIVSEGIPSSLNGQRVIQPVIVGRSTHGHVVVACRGTADLADLIADLKIIPKWLRSSSGGAAAHMGFVERAESIDIEPFLSLLSKGERLVFTGHSLGGAVSSLLALRVLEAAESHNICTHMGQLQCITFGSPLFASPSLANCINEKYHERFCHVVSQHDLVPRIVPLLRMAQVLVGSGGDDISQGMQLIRFGLQAAENITRVPVATAFRTVERFIPSPVRLGFSHFIRMILPHRPPQQYAFAGNFLFIDPLEQDPDLSAKFHAGEQMNVFRSELAFALGLNMNVVEHHGLSAYQRGLVKGFKSSILQVFKKKGKETPVRMPGLQENKEFDAAVAMVKSQSPLSLPAKNHRHSTDYGIDHMIARPGGGAAGAAMSASTRSFKPKKQQCMARRSMEKNFADCMARLALMDDSRPAQGLEQAMADRESGGACSGTPAIPLAPLVKPANVFGTFTPGKGVQLSSQGQPLVSTPRPLDMVAPASAPLSRYSTPKKVMCCEACEEKRRAGQALDLSIVRLKPAQSALDEEDKLKEKKGLHWGWLIRTVLRVTSLMTSVNSLSVTCCAVRLLLGSPLF